jgi:hypothetical protein
VAAKQFICCNLPINFKEGEEESAERKRRSERGILRPKFIYTNKTMK